MQQNKTEDIAGDVYAGFVRSLFNDPGVLLVGGLCHGLIGLLVYFTSQDPVYIGLALAMLAAGFYRYYGIRKGQRLGTFDHAGSAKRWERYYLVGGTIQAFFMGLFCFFTIYLRPDSFGESAAIAVIMGSTVTIVGRNYGSKTMVAVQAVTVVLPIAVALMLKGSVANFVLGLYVVPFIFIITRMVSHVRTVLFKAISQRKVSTRLAQRFNRALNTMSHGLVMLGPDGKVVVANAEAARLMAMKTPEALLGRSIQSLLRRGAASGMLAPEECRYVEAQLTRALREGRDRKVLVSFTNGQHYEFSAREGSQELGVITFEDVTQRVEAEERIRFMARYDNLTGLVNRPYFHELVSEAMAEGDRGRLCGLAVIDLDDFKSTNDTLGHPVGDGLIYAVASRLTAFASENVKVGRFGGDEFMIYFDRVEDEADLVAQLETIFAALKGDVDIAGHVLRIQASGGAVLAGAGTCDVDAMIVKADLALYKAKELGKDGWQLFEAAMDAAFRNKQRMKADLRAAVEAKALRVVYQPIVSMGTMRIASCEALCRWDHAELGPISPAIFIPLAEEMGIISEISDFVLKAACTQCTTWPEHTTVSVNLSAKDFRSADVVQKVRDALAASGLAAWRLEVEVTETALLDDKSQTRELVEEIRKLGVRIALDDFGTGYSSLSYLHKLPLDKVKIDGSFVKDLAHSGRSLELLKGVIDLSRRLGLAVTVEGVETFEQLRVLSDQVRPDLLQGFLFGSALSATGIEAMSSATWPFAAETQSLVSSEQL